MNDLVVFNTLTEMLKDRGYISIPSFNITDEYFIIDDVLCIFFCNQKTGINTVKNIESKLLEVNKSNCIIILTDGITSFAKQYLCEIDVIHFEFFNHNELLINVTKHSLVPKHTLMPKSFLKTLCLKLKCKPNNLPVILLSDPISRYYGAQLNNVFEISRDSEFEPVSKYYRICKT